MAINFSRAWTASTLAPKTTVPVNNATNPNLTNAAFNLGQSDLLGRILASGGGGGGAVFDPMQSVLNRERARAIASSIMQQGATNWQLARQADPATWTGINQIRTAAPNFTTLNAPVINPGITDLTRLQNMIGIQNVAASAAAPAAVSPGISPMGGWGGGRVPGFI